MNKTIVINPSDLGIYDYTELDKKLNAGWEIKNIVTPFVAPAEGYQSKVVYGPVIYHLEMAS